MKLLFAVSLVLFLSACATEYRVENSSGGYSNTQPDKNIFQVTFRGNKHTSLEQVEEMALLRGAQLALMYEFTHFTIIDTQTKTSTRSVTAPTQSVMLGSATSFGNLAFGFAGITIGGGQSVDSASPTVVKTIFCYTGKPEGITAAVYSARFICDSIGSKYDVKC